MISSSIMRIKKQQKHRHDVILKAMSKEEKIPSDTSLLSCSL
jgi:hypothetical protein